MNNNFSIPRIRKVYQNMMARCNNTDHVSYKNYGGIGVKVKCSKDEFLRWYLDHVAGDIENPQVDRIDNRGHYEISNMQILSRSENAKKTIRQNPRYDVKIANMKKYNHSKSEPVIVNGIAFRSCNAAGRAFEMDGTTIRKAIHRVGSRRLVIREVMVSRIFADDAKYTDFKRE